MVLCAGHDARTAHRECPPQHSHYALDSTSTMTRKVASAPPPQAYTGFSSVTGSGHTSRSYLKGEKKPPYVGKGISRASGVRHPMPRSTFSTHSSLGTGARPTQTFKSKSTITPSSWRAGKELADRALGRERKPPLSSFLSKSAAEFNHLETREHSSPLSHTYMSLSPSNSVHVPMMQTDSFPKETNDNAAGMLMDLELSSEGEQEEHNEADLLLFALFIKVRSIPELFELSDSFRLLLWSHKVKMLWRQKCQS